MRRPILRLVLLAALASAIVACDGGATTPAGASEGQADATGIAGAVVAGPTCPVVTDPPDPSCADRPVAGAVLVVSVNGTELTRVTSASDGTFRVALAPGTYRVIPQPVDGLLGTAAEQEVVVEAQALAEIVVSYDTGIR
jgi:hypothetical protein